MLKGERRHGETPQLNPGYDDLKSVRQSFYESSAFA